MKKFLTRIFNKVKWYDLRSTVPVSQTFGLDRGTALDRIYIENFLAKHAKCISGRTLEISEDYYSRKFGAKVDQYEILHYSSDNPKATIIGDLTNFETLPSSIVDCFICTQTLNFIYDFKSAIQGAWHLLTEKGVMLTTVAGISQVSRYDMDRWGDYWRFNTLSMQKSFEEVFGEGNVEVECYGNVLTAVSLLEGISAEELTKKEIFYKDTNYQVIIGIKAQKHQ